MRQLNSVCNNFLKPVSDRVNAGTITQDRAGEIWKNVQTRLQNPEQAFRMRGILEQRALYNNAMHDGDRNKVSAYLDARETYVTDLKAIRQGPVAAAQPSKDQAMDVVDRNATQLRIEAFGSFYQNWRNGVIKSPRQLEEMPGRIRDVVRQSRARNAARLQEDRAKAAAKGKDNAQPRDHSQSQGGYDANTGASSQDYSGPTRGGGLSRSGPARAPML